MRSLRNRRRCGATYVLFSLGDDGIARDYDAFRAANRSRLEQYLAQFVVPAIP